MFSERQATALESVLKLLCYILPILLLLFGAYFFYFGVYLRNKVTKTINDISVITQNIQDSYSESKYYQFDTNLIALGNFLPYDIEPKQRGSNYYIPNRFGGQMHFYEAFSNKQERTLFMALHNKPEQYKKVYTGVGAYMIVLTNLNKRECSSLSLVDWRQVNPNFMGIEAAYLTPSKLYSGTYNLKTYVLKDNLGEQYSTKDDGIVSRHRLTPQETKKACNCNWRSCTVALKFL